jgi:pilus assembly protein Flp/PilA
MIQKLMDFFKDEQGATAVEYGVMIAVIAAFIIGVVIAVGQSTNGAFDTVGTELGTINSGS